MDQHDNSSFQPDDQPHSSHFTEPQPFIDSSETLPLLSDTNEEVTQTTEEANSFSENPLLNGAQTVTCRVCEHQIPYESKSMNHVVKCPSCLEATPIRAAPTGKKFVRCLCNCLLICRVSSNRIACPRPNCNRVIILKPNTNEGAIPAPAGTARISCYYCQEVFIYNTIANAIVKCPHCQKKSSIGVAYLRSRTFLYLAITLIALLALIFLMIWSIGDFGSHPWVIIIYILLFILILVYAQKFARFVKMKTSQIVGPV